MNDDKDFREPKTASQSTPLELHFTFVVPRQLLPVACRCPESVEREEHLHLPPTTGGWDQSDDMSPDMYFTQTMAVANRCRAKIEYELRVKILSSVNGKLASVAEVSEPIQIMPFYPWFQRQQSVRSGQASPAYEPTQPPFFQTPPPPSIPTRTVEAEKKIKKGVFGKKKGSVQVSLEAPEFFELGVGHDETPLPPNSLTLPIKMRYLPITADLPPKVTAISARLHSRTTFNVDSHKDFRNSGTYQSSIVILKASTPSPSTPLWVEGESSTDLSFVANIVMPITLPPAAGSPDTQAQKVLLPSFESCFVSRSYEIEVRIGFDGGNELALRTPISILAKPATQKAESDLEYAIQAANNWTPPGHETLNASIEPELLRPTLRTLRIDDHRGSTSSEESTGTVTESPGMQAMEFHGGCVEEVVPAVPAVTEIVPGEAPPDYSLVVQTVANGKDNGVQQTVTAVFARTA